MTLEQATQLLVELATIREILSCITGVLVGGFFGGLLSKWIA